MMDKSKVTCWLNETDGYSILKPEFFLEMGIPSDLVKRHTHNYRNDPALGKNSATRNDGKPGDVHGIGEFGMVDAVADLFEVEACHEYLGRGKNFRTTVERILKAIKEGEE